MKTLEKGIERVEECPDGDGFAKLLAELFKVLAEKGAPTGCVILLEFRDSICGWNTGGEKTNMNCIREAMEASLDAMEQHVEESKRASKGLPLVRQVAEAN